MSEQPVDELEASPGPEEDPGAQLPRVPWSQIREDFIATWGYPEGKFQPEHLEILGPSGSGKTYLEATLLQERQKARNSAIIFIATKPVDATILLLGYPIVDTWKGVTKNRQCIFWPRTRKVGEQREIYLEEKLYDLLSRLWGAGAKVIVVFDEVSTAEKLSPRLKKLIEMYWREARSSGITIVAMKQRGQGALRDMHSEAAWIAAFRPKHEEDGKYVGAIMGSWRVWLPILRSLDRSKREFVLLHSVTQQAVITWVDTPLRPAAPPKRGLYRRAS